MSKLSDHDIDQIHLSKIIPLEIDVMQNFEEIEDEVKSSILDLMSIWQRTINESFTRNSKTILPNPNLGLAKSISNKQFNFKTESYFLKKTQIIILERFTEANGQFKDNTRLVLKGFMHFLIALDCLEIIKNSSDSKIYWSKFSSSLNHISNSVFRFAVYVHQNTRFEL